MNVVNADTSFKDAELSHMMLGNDMDYSKRRKALANNDKYLCENNRQACFHQNKDGNLVKCGQS